MAPPCPPYAAGVSLADTGATTRSLAGGGRPARSLLVVTGSGRSGTSLVAGLLKRLGCRVPEPEVPADESNPRGFAESQWVVDLHTRLLRAAGVQVSDARPSAWAQTAKVGMDPRVQAEVRAFLQRQFAAADDVVIKDPRLSWFLPVWRRAAQDVGATPRVITMLRHPAAVVTSKQRYYGGRQGEACRAAGWVNQILFTERATRDAPRVFLRYERLLEDWTATLAHAGEILDLGVVRDAPAPAIRRAHEFIDVSLDRSRPAWGDLRVPAALQAQAEQVWDQVKRLADDTGAPAPETIDQLDTLRAAYTVYYTEAESVAYSSIADARSHSDKRAQPSLPLPVRRVARRVPRRLRYAIPRPVRAGIIRALGR